MENNYQDANGALAGSEADQARQIEDILKNFDFGCRQSAELASRALQMVKEGHQLENRSRLSPSSSRAGFIEQFVSTRND